MQVKGLKLVRYISCWKNVEVILISKDAEALRRDFPIGKNVRRVKFFSSDSLSYKYYSM